MLYFLGVNHGYQIVGEFPHRTEPFSQLTFHQLSENITQYQKPFLKWLRKFISKNRILYIFEEWTLINDSDSSASLLSKDQKIHYIQIDKFPQVTEELREGDWVEKIIKTFPDENDNGLVIIGDNHCESLREKINSRGLIDIEIIRQKSLESLLIHKT